MTKTTASPQIKRLLEEGSEVDNSKKIKSESGGAQKENQKMLKLMSWNVGGLNACLKKGFSKIIENENCDIFCLQETKLNGPMEYVSKALYPYQYQSHSTSKKGYSGTALFSKIKPLNVSYSVAEDEFNKEGRYIIAEYEKFYFVNAYIPNAGSKLERLDAKRAHYKKLIPFLESLGAKKSLIFAGDLNVAHQEIDLSRPKTNHKTAGFTPGERADFTKLMETVGLIDSYRHLHPKASDKYTYYSYRFNCYAKNLGWRLDYFLVSSSLQDSIVEADIRKDDYGGSDHVPLICYLKELV